MSNSYDPQSPSQFKTVPLQHQDAMGVAMKRNPFGEGSERFAFQFFELADDYRTIVGKSLVAKESRFFFTKGKNCSPKETWNLREKFVKTFCSAQQQARVVADAFNAKLDAMPNLDPFTARVSFVNCSVYYINDKELGKIAVLVEPKLDPRKFKKWNNNYGVRMMIESIVTHLFYFLQKKIAFFCRSCRECLGKEKTKLRVKRLLMTNLKDPSVRFL